MIYGNLILNGMSPLNEETLHSDVRKNHEVVDIQTLMDELINTITGLHLVLDLGRHMVEDVIKTWVELIKVSYRLKNNNKNNNQNNFISSTVMCDEKIDEPSSELEYLANRLLYIHKLFIQLQEDYQQRLSNIENDQPGHFQDSTMLESFKNTICLYEHSEQKIPYEKSDTLHRQYFFGFIFRIFKLLNHYLPCYNSPKTILSFNVELPDYKKIFLKMKAVFAYHNLELLEHYHCLHQNKDLQIVLLFGSSQLTEQLYQKIIDSSYMPECRYYNHRVFLERAQKISDSLLGLLPDILKQPFSVRTDLAAQVRNCPDSYKRQLQIIQYEKTFIQHMLSTPLPDEEFLFVKPHQNQLYLYLLRHRLTTDNMIFFVSIIKAIKSKLSTIDDDGNQRLTEYYAPIYQSLGLCYHLVCGMNFMTNKFVSVTNKNFTAQELEIFAQKNFTKKEIGLIQSLSQLSLAKMVDTDSVEFMRESANIEHYLHPMVETVQLPTYTYNPALHHQVSIPMIAYRIWESYKDLSPQTQELSKEIYTKYLDFYVLMSASIKAIHAERAKLQELLRALPAEYQLKTVDLFMQNYNEELSEFTRKHKERLGDPQPKTITKNITITQPNNKT